MPRTDPPSTDRLDLVKDWLDELLDTPPEERDAAIVDLRLQHPELVDEVLQLLGAHEDADPNTIRAVARGATAFPASPPTTLGPYRIGDQIGEGGMACVFRAEQTAPIERSVAIKLLRPDAASPDLVARFRDERQLLARLEHPGIARVIDAGESTEGQAYLVMELVEGQPITAFCRDESVPLSERVQLVIGVACAVQHAHNRGVLHRDLKPSNVLVWRDGEGLRSKVIDFGVAKLFGRVDLVGDLERTRAGQIVGTLEYMSPEQAGFGDGIVDARSDVFSLATVLYELIADDLPSRVEGSGVAALSGFLRDLETAEPLRPTRLLRDRSLIDLPHHTVEDIECVVLRALDRDPARRYGTAAAFADDLERALVGRPVEARPPTRSYLLARFARRHRLLVTGGAAVLLSLLVGMAGVSFGLLREKEHSRELASALEESDQLVAYYANMLLGARADRLGPETPLSEAVEVAADGIEADTTLGPGVRGRLAAAAGESLHDLERLERAEEMLLLGVTLLEAAEDTQAHSEARLKALWRLGLIAQDDGRFDVAEQRYRATLEIAERLAVDGDERARRELAGIEESLSSLLDDGGDSMAAIPLQEAALRELEALGASPLDLAGVRANLALTLRRAGDYAGAEEASRRSYDTRLSALPADDMRVINVARILAGVVSQQGRHEESVAIVEAVVRDVTLADDDPRRLLLDASLSVMRFRAAPGEETAQAIRDVAARAEAVFGPDHRMTERFAVYRLEADLLDPAYDARLAVEDIVARLGSRIGVEHPDMPRVQLTVAQVLRAGGRDALARPLFQSARDALAASNSTRPPIVAELDAILDTTE